MGQLATSTAGLIDQVLRALRDDHGGAYPDEVLERWAGQREDLHDRQIFKTPEEKEAMVKIWKTWRDSDWVKKTFWCFNIDDPYTVTGDHVPQVKQCLLEWLRKRRAGELYPSDEEKLD
ncbi:hypothetical protein FQN54_007683 [Arachnomyces sp. PD_36]|nr:hypothetical protein FQN54_007683 [Arachnomyces sp. PD_36]